MKHTSFMAVIAVAAAASAVSMTIAIVWGGDELGGGVIYYDKNTNSAECADIFIPNNLMSGSDMDPPAAAEYLLHVLSMLGTEYQCLYIVNGIGDPDYDGYMPTVHRRVDAQWLHHVMRNGHDENAMAEFDDIACEMCPFTELAYCPQCVVIHEEAYVQMHAD